MFSTATRTGTRPSTSYDIYRLHIEKYISERLRSAVPHHEVFQGSAQQLVCRQEEHKGLAPCQPAV